MPYLCEPLCLACGVPQTPDSSGLHVRRCNSTICTMPDSQRALDRVSSVFAHKEGGRQAATRLKYRGVSSLSRWLGHEMAQVARHRQFNRIDAIVPVPLHVKRLRERGYNQSALLGRAVGRELNIAFIPASLVRQRATRSQVGLGSRERTQNVAAAFSWQGAALRGQSLLLIDDVCTTGATLNACAATLKAAGAERVLALTLTREFFGLKS